MRYDFLILSLVSCTTNGVPLASNDAATPAGGGVEASSSDATPVDGASTTNETWSLTSFSVGKKADNDLSQGSIYMPDVLRLADGRLRMYYLHGNSEGDEVKVAESSDSGSSWTVKGTCIKGSSVKTDRTFRQGGPSVVALADGRYRMYLRASEDSVNSTPKFHVVSAISSDGLTFTAEAGVRIEIVSQDPNSTFSLAGHGRYYTTADGKYAGIFSGNLTTDLGASDLHLAISADGLTWGGYETLYADYHDPVVIKVNGAYVMYAMYLKDWVARFDSPDGVTWPTQPTAKLTLEENGTAIPLANVGDFAAVVLGDGSVQLFSNYAATPPSVDIVRYLKKP